MKMCVSKEALGKSYSSYYNNQLLCSYNDNGGNVNNDNNNNDNTDDISFYCASLKAQQVKTC